MRIVKIVAKGLPLYKDNEFTLNMYASDRVAKNEDDEIADVKQLGKSGSIYSQNILGLVGVNAAGKTTTLNLVNLVVSFLSDLKVSRHAAPEVNRIGRLDGPLELSVVLFQNGEFYLLESMLVCPHPQASSGCVRGDDLIFTDEVLWRLNCKRPKRTLFDNLDEFKENAVVDTRRNGDPAKDSAVLSGTARMYLDDQTSVATRLTGKNGTTESVPAGVLPREDLPASVLRAFDPTIESLSYDAKMQVYHLKFKGEPECVMGPDAIPSYLSQGTIVGADMVRFATQRLCDGGFMLVDEIEASLNRSLVGAIINLFASPATNPHGAQLIFTTHVPELLDEVRRKDAVYVLRKDSGVKTEVVRYSDEVKRIENKKSAAILRNVVRGSMPNYPDVQAMRMYVKERVDGE